MAHPLPPTIPPALDALVDRLNLASGQLPESGLPPPVLALLVGTSEGVGLLRSYGTGNAGGDLSEEVLSSVETSGATLPGGCGPHAARAASVGGSGAGQGGVQHPLLSPIGLGGAVRTVTAMYDTVTVVQIQMAPLVVTVLASPSANIGAIRSTALPVLKDLLGPVREKLVESREGQVAAGAGQYHPGQVAGSEGYYQRER